MKLTNTARTCHETPGICTIPSLTSDTMSISKNIIPCLPLLELKNARTMRTSTAVTSTPAHSGSFGNSLVSVASCFADHQRPSSQIERDRRAKKLRQVRRDDRCLRQDVQRPQAAVQGGAVLWILGFEPEEQLAGLVRQ